MSSVVYTARRLRETTTIHVQYTIPEDLYRNRRRHVTVEMLGLMAGIVAVEAYRKLRGQQSGKDLSSRWQQN